MRLAATLLLGILAVAAPVGAAHAAGSISDPAPSGARANDPNFDAGRRAIDAKNWPDAVNYLNLAASADPKNPDIQNYLGFAHRNSGNLDLAFTHYARALELDPKHKGAHEYLGEAYLMKGDLAKAEEMLGKLDKLCLFTCAEYTELKTKIAAFKARRTG